MLQVVCGFDHTLVLAEDGSLFSFGDNLLSQLGRASQPQASRVLSWGRVDMPDN
jgi:alpha-tubulin suppressor-like RCC1 family protein